MLTDIPHLVNKTGHPLNECPCICAIDTSTRQNTSFLYCFFLEHTADYQPSENTPERLPFCPLQVRRYAPSQELNAVKDTPLFLFLDTDCYDIAACNYYAQGIHCIPILQYNPLVCLLSYLSPLIIKNKIRRMCRILLVFTESVILMLDPTHTHHC